VGKRHALKGVPRLQASGSRLSAGWLAVNILFWA